MIQAVSDACRFKQERDNLFAAVVELEMLLEEYQGRIPPIDPAIRKAMWRMTNAGTLLGSSERNALAEHDAQFLTDENTP